LKVFSWTFMFTFMGERLKKAVLPLKGNAVPPKKPLQPSPKERASR